MTAPSSRAACTIVPPYLLAALTGHADEAVAECARRSLDRDHTLREPPLRQASRAPPRPPTTRCEHQGGLAAPHADDGTGPQRTIGDAKGAQTTPGTTVRREGESATDDWR